MKRYEIDPMRPEDGIRVVETKPSKKDRPRSRLFNSWDAAKDNLLSIAAYKVGTARLALNRAKGIESNIKGMKHPKE